MNKTLTAFARQQLKDGLAQLPEENQRIFMIMYSHKNMDRTIDEAVDAMPNERLDWAMQQVENSLIKANIVAKRAGS
jgi:hypothetical protein